MQMTHLSLINCQFPAALLCFHAVRKDLLRVESGINLEVHF